MIPGARRSKQWADRFRRIAWAVLAASLAAGCGAANETSTRSVRPAQATSPEDDLCADSPPLPKRYEGLLRSARCDQEKFSTMAMVATELGVACSFCHEKDPDAPAKENYAASTHRKEIANWMSMHLMRSVKPIGGGPFRCATCHTDEGGRPIAAILGTPRDPVRAPEWMSRAMVQRFSAADGAKLACKSCHVGDPGSAEWQSTVLLRSSQIPPHGEALPPPRSAENSK